MPSPYTLNVNLDIWSTNTDMKLQIMEQLLMLFNPSLEIQTTDNYVDWSSLTVVELTSMNFSSRTIPQGTESEIDIAQLSFTTPIYINLPAKVKKLGVITNVIMSIFDESKGTIDLGTSMPELQAYSDAEPNQAKTDLQTGKIEKDGINIQAGNYQNYDILIMGNQAQIVDRGRVGSVPWDEVIQPHPGQYKAGLSQLQIKRKLLAGESGSISINGSITINELDQKIKDKIHNKISLATIYNTVHAFEKKGYLKQIPINSSQTYFDTNITDHHHFYNLRDGKLIDLENSDVGPINIKKKINGKKIKSIEVLVKLED